ncbi:2-phosphosulfolactate phosphatase [Litoribacter ruber]|uniref:Probable 2-phosphosulfolactate phosphatase n=1 Tax=Litoribacter ruber TaxID=702568 RepID=A0AAP2CJA2_9BACT|nr:MULTISPECIES: 2-phosphosulfolactate phosphatase [Litoribacter]MBS9522792.1 2-phosphosulfolactate phosphatase [Litoribacter alkaliphilus]MBT0811273.1 2-phosphosulfolactate phosphatase [Litoribacter ruber]
MRNIEVCLTPELIHLYDLQGKIVIIVDIFRATSTMVTALANKVDSVTPVENLEVCRQMANEGYVIAGERNGKTAEGFALGNSPLSYLDNGFLDKKIAMTTTNGTLAIEKSKSGSSEILIGAFLNLHATASYLKSKKEDILILCAGWKGKFNLEDSLYAGALIDALSEDLAYDCDGALATRALYQANKNNISGFLAQASHAKRLQNHNIEADIDFCLTFDKYDLVGKLVDGKLVVWNWKTVGSRS